MAETNSQASEYAVIKTGGKQFRVSPGSKISVNQIEGEPGSAVTFSEVVLFNSGKDNGIKVGAPLISGAKVVGKILAHDKTAKVLIYKKARRTGYTKKQGHRQAVTKILIESISA